VIIQIAAVLWSVLGYFSGSELLFSIGALICMALNIIQIAARQTEPLASVAVYVLSAIVIGPLRGVMVAGILLCTMSVVKYRIKVLYPSKADMGC